MEIDSPEHKAQFLQDLIKAFYENVWKSEIQLLEFEELLGNKRKEKAALDLKLSEKGKPPANVEKRILERREAEIESINAAINKTKADKEFCTKRIEVLRKLVAQGFEQ
jgi:hypothetical protein